MIWSGATAGAVATQTSSIRRCLCELKAAGRGPGESLAIDQAATAAQTMPGAGSLTGGQAAVAAQAVPGAGSLTGGQAGCFQKTGSREPDRSQATTATQAF